MIIWEVLGIGGLFVCAIVGALTVFVGLYMWSARDQRLARERRDAEERSRLRMVAATADLNARGAEAAAAIARANELIAVVAAERALSESLRVTIPRRRKSALPWGSFNPAVPVPTVVAIDLETTGLDAKVDRIIEVALVAHDGSGWSRFVNPGRPIPERIRDLTGITDADVANAPTFGQVWDEVKRAGLLDGRFPVAYNATFDQGFLAAELVRANRLDEAKSVMDLEWIDPMLVVKEIDEGSARLADACVRRGIAPPEHRALTDARACLTLFFHLERTSPRFTARPLGVVLQEQIASRAPGKR